METDLERKALDGYADDTRLNVRYRTHALYSVDPVEFGRWTPERPAWHGNERVLDVTKIAGALAAVKEG